MHGEKKKKKLFTVSRVSQNIPQFSNCILVNYKGKYKDEKAVKICIFD